MPTQKREDHGENDRVCQSRWDAGLTGSEKTARTWGNGQKETWAESQEENGGHDQIGLGQHKTHRLRDETVDEEEHERMEHNSHLSGLSVEELDISALGSQQNAGAESQKKGGWDRDFLGSNIWKHV